MSSPAGQGYALDAGWDDELLQIEIEGLKDMGYDIGLTGFDDNELAALFGENDEAKEDDFDVEEELEKPCFSKTGDIWHLGKHTVICGDSTEPDTFKSLLGDTKVNLVCTDAPYFVNLENKSGKIANDNLDDKSAYEFLMNFSTGTDRKYVCLMIISSAAPTGKRFFMTARKHG